MPSSNDDNSPLENVFFLINADTPDCNEHETKPDELSNIKASQHQQTHVSSVPIHDRNRPSKKSSRRQNPSTVFDRDDVDRRLCTVVNMHTWQCLHERSGLDRYVRNRNGKRPVSLDWIAPHRKASGRRLDGYGDVPGTRLCLVEVGVARLLPFLQPDKAHVVVTRCIRKGATSAAPQHPSTCVTTLTGNTEAEN